MADVLIPSVKSCSKCGEEKPLSRFYAYLAQCKDCLCAAQKDYYKRNPRDQRKGVPKPGRPKSTNKLARHHLSMEAYAELYQKQNGQCAICGKVGEWRGQQRLAVDHCHATGLVRGLLCCRCNTRLGRYKDNPEALRHAGHASAAAYIERAKRFP